MLGNPGLGFHSRGCWKLPTVLLKVLGTTSKPALWQQSRTPVLTVCCNFSSGFHDTANHLSTVSHILWLYIYIYGYIKARCLLYIFFSVNWCYCRRSKDLTIDFFFKWSNCHSDWKSTQGFHISVFSSSLLERVGCLAHCLSTAEDRHLY